MFVKLALNNDIQTSEGARGEVKVRSLPTWKLRFGGE